MFSILNNRPVYDTGEGSGSGTSSPAPAASSSLSPSPAAAATPSPSPSATPSSTPSATPTPAAGATPVATSDSDNGDEFDGLGLDFNLEPSEAPTGQTPPAQQATPPVQAQQQTPAAQQTQQPQPTGQQDGQQQQQTQPQQDSVDPASVEGILQAFEKGGGDFIAQLAAGPFALDKATQDALEADALAETPKLLARTFLHSVTASLKYMQQIVPQIVQRQVQTMRAQQKAEAAFFKKWPQLKPDKHGADIRRIAQTFNQLNPRATQEQIIASVGATVLAMHGLSATPSTPGPQANGGQPPFVPAQGGAPVITAPVVEDEWSGLGQDYDN